MGISSTILIGFLLGLRHVLDPDHLVAVSNLVASGKSVPKAAKVGFIWGIGHSLVVLIVGILWIVSGIHVSSSFSGLFETLVGAILILLGVITIWKYQSGKVHIHTHHHDNVTHAHFHYHENQKHAHSIFEKSWVAFVIGCFHGLAGSAAILLLMLSTVPEQSSFTYLIVFCLGTIISMSILSFLFGFVISITNGRYPLFQKYILISSGVICFLFGIWWIIAAA